MVFLTISMIIDLSILIYDHLNPILADMSLKKLEKRGKMIKRMSRGSQMLLLMSAIDIFFYCGN